MGMNTASMDSLQVILATNSMRYDGGCTEELKNSLQNWMDRYHKDKTNDIVFQCKDRILEITTSDIDLYYELDYYTHMFEYISLKTID